MSLYDDGHFPTDLGYKVLAADIDDIADTKALEWRKAWTTRATRSPDLTEAEKIELAETLKALNIAIEENE